VFLFAVFRRAVSLRLGKALAVPGAAVPLYGKADSRPRRKLGHETVMAPDVASARERAEAGVVALGV
jgi:5-(carboxyamino)imidazole ribonucleotide synthase